MLAGLTVTSDLNARLGTQVTLTDTQGTRHY